MSPDNKVQISEGYVLVISNLLQHEINRLRQVRNQIGVLGRRSRAKLQERRHLCKEILQNKKGQNIGTILRQATTAGHKLIEVLLIKALLEQVTQARKLLVWGVRHNSGFLPG